MKMFRPPYFTPRLLVLAIWVWTGWQASAAAILQITNRTWSTAGFNLQWTNLGPETGYTVQTRDWLLDGVWLPGEATLPWPTLSNAWTDATAVSNQARFYRVLGVPTAERGKILQVTTNDTYAASNILALLIATDIPITAEVAPVYSVQVLKINYETISPLGGRIRASGALALPVGASGLPLASYQHGTLARTNEAPSVNSLSETLLGVVFAGTGYATALPDYLGLGESEGIQAYHHASSEATAAVDLLRAARSYCASNNVALNGQLFLCGYSQGGHATMALLRELETFHTNEFAVTACAPMAGAYDLSGVTASDFLSGQTVPNPYYFGLLLAAYQDVYHLAPTLADLLVAPYNSTLPPLLQGATSSGTINAAMPNPPLQALKPEYITAFRNNPHAPLRIALWANDLYRWSPRSPLRMFQCGGDHDVNPTNAIVALNSFHSRGATQVELIVPSPTADHGECVMPSMLAAKQWFDSLR